MGATPYKISFIQFHTTKYGDSSIILHGYSSYGGRQSFMIRGAGKSKKGSSINNLHPLSILEIETAPGRFSSSSSQYHSDSLQYLKEFSPKYRLNSIRSNIHKSSIAIFICELLYKILLHNEEAKATYDFLEKSILLLNETESSFSNFHLWFIISLISRLGFNPSFIENLEFSHFSKNQRIIIDKILTTSFEDFMAVALSGDERSDFLNSSIKYIEYHLSIKLNIKSLNILHQVLR